MSRATRARDKAFRAAATFLADQWGYTGIERDEVIATTIQDRAGDWKVIWDRGRRYSDKWWTALNDEAAAEVQRHLEEARKAATKLYETVAYKDKLLMERLADNNRLTMRNREQEGSIRTLMANTQKLRDDLSRLKVDLVQRPSTLKVRALEMELSKVRAELEETKKHTTQATWGVFEENERLVIQIRGLENDLALAEDEVADERLCRQKAEVPLVACQTVMGKHACIHWTQPGKHPQRHQCHCGTAWS